MSDPNMPSEMDVRPARQGGLRRLSLVWIVPLLALAISLGVAYQNYAQRGTLIEIAFDDAKGIAAGETVIKYRDVDVGRVEKVSFAPGLGEVIVQARIDAEVAPFLDDDASFWVVEPEVTLRGVTGLQTVLSGVYIEGSWDAEADVQQFEFVGLEQPPLTRARQRGTQIVFRARDGQALADGAPILHKGIRVGFLEAPELSFDGSSVIANAFVEAPFDQRITTATRFWDTSGFSVSIGAGGVSLDVSSLASLIEGGIAFDTVVSGGAPIRDGQVFDIFASEETARESLFSSPDVDVLNVAVLFENSVNGLTKGSEVRFQGLRIGSVTDLTAVVVEDRDAARVQLRAILAVEPVRLGLGEDASPEDALSFLSDFVLQGLRARLVTGNILSGSLVVELVKVDDAPTAVMNMAAEPYPQIPTTTSNITDVADSAEDVLKRIEALPIEALMSGAIDLMDSIERLANDEGLKQAPASLTALLDETRGLIGSEDVTRIPAEIRQSLEDLNTIIAQAQETGTVTRLNAAIDSVTQVANNIDDATQNLSAISALLEQLAGKANSLDIEGLFAAARDTVSNIDVIVRETAAQDLPASVAAVIDDLRGIVASDDLAAIPSDLRQTIAQVNDIVAQAAGADLVTQLSGLIDAANATVANIDTAAADLPAITAQLNALATKANGLDLETLVAQTTATINSIDTLVGSQSTQDIPASLSAALDEVRAFLGDVRSGGAVNNLNAALASANEAAKAIEDAVAGLPALSARASALVAETGDVLEGYGERSRFNAEMLSALRDIQEAADSVSSLARAIQRNPNSLLTGR